MKTGLPESPSCALSERECGLLFESTHERQAVRIIAGRLDDGMEVVRHEAVRDNCKAVSIRSTTKLRQDDLARRSIFKPAPAAVTADCKEIPLDADVLQAREAWWRTTDHPSWRGNSGAMDAVFEQVRGA